MGMSSVCSLVPAGGWKTLGGNGEDEEEMHCEHLRELGVDNRAGRISAATGLQLTTCG